MTVYGQTPVGAFGVNTLEHVEGAAKLGMNLIFSYSPESCQAATGSCRSRGQGRCETQDAGHVSACAAVSLRCAWPAKSTPTDTTIPVVGERPRCGALVPGIRLPHDRGRAHRVRRVAPPTASAAASAAPAARRPLATASTCCCAIPRVCARKSWPSRTRPIYGVIGSSTTTGHARSTPCARCRASSGWPTGMHRAVPTATSS